MVVQTNCLIVVTYRDSNYMWKDRAINQADITEIVVTPTERAVHYFAPKFWGPFAQPSRIERVTVTQQGHTFRLPWHAEVHPAAPSALALDLRLPYAGHAMLTGVTWK
jgi:hypothetical protein